MAAAQGYESATGPDPVALASSAADAVAALTALPWAQVPTPALAPVLVELTRAQSALDAVRLSVSEAIDSADVAADHGWASTKDFLTAITGGHKGTGGGLLRLARRLRGLPHVADALAAGDISAAHARVIASRATTLPKDDTLRHAASAAMLAKVGEEKLDATDLDRAFPTLLAELDPDGSIVGAELALEARERGAHAARFLAFSRDEVGGIRVRGYGTPEDVERIKTALMPLAAPVTSKPGACGGEPGPRLTRDPQGRRLTSGCPDPLCAHDGRDPREHGVRLWDALVEACDRLAAAQTLPADHTGTPRLIVTTDLTTLKDRVTSSGGDHSGSLLGGESLSAAAVRRLACDAEVIPVVLGSRSQVLDVGRANRFVTAAMWYALVVRDQHCAFPGCTRLPIACDAHHIVHWADGGTTALSNLVMLCRRHHTLVHRSPWTVTIDKDTGRPVWTPPPEVDDRGRFTFSPPTRPPPGRAA